MECTFCKIQDVGKAETPFNIRLKNHRKDANNPKAIPASTFQTTWSQLQKPCEIHAYTAN